MLKYIGILSFFILCTGCIKQEYDECNPPQEDLQVLFKKKSNLQPFSHSFCIVCNPSLSSEEIQSWAIEMGAESISDNPDTPCLYAYADREEFPNGFETLQHCQRSICEEGAQYNDIVSRENGNIDLDPILGSTD